MKSGERNSFERELEKDPFASEAIEGFDGLNKDEVLKDLTSLQKQIKSKTGNKKRLIYVRIAASLAVLMVISSIYIIINRSKTEKLISENSRTEKQIEIYKAPSLSEPSVPDDKKIAMNVPAVPGQRTNAEPAPASKDKIAELEKIEEIKKTSVVSELKDVQKILVKTEAEAKALTIEQSIQSAKAEEVRENVSVPARAKKADNNIAGAGITVQSEDVKQITVYTPAQPVNGQEDFKRYIDKNIKRPAGTKPGQVEVVILQFRVKSDGMLDSLKIISSPGILYSDEARRLIKEGPEWKPAEKNNIKIDEVVKLQIDFK
jgi:hypothetical protein